MTSKYRMNFLTFLLSVIVWGYMKHIERWVNNITTVLQSMKLNVDKWSLVQIARYHILPAVLAHH